LGIGHIYSYILGNGLKFNLSIHAQILDLLDNSGTTGMTLNVSIAEA